MLKRLAVTACLLALLTPTAAAARPAAEPLPSAASPPTGEAERLVTESVTIPRPDGVTLEGEVIAPASAASAELPALVLVHGSGPGRRDGLRLVAEAFARDGIVTLIYDKRSKGYSRTRRDYGMLADDALAAVDVLRRQDGIDQERVGLWGVSEGGWVVPLAASRSQDVDFVVTVAANSIRPLDQEQWNVHNKLGHHGIRGSMVRSYSVNLPRQAAEAGVFSEAYHEPLPVLEKVRQPVLAIWGEYDRLTPPAESLTTFRRVLERSGNRHYTLRILPDAQHSLYRTPDKGFSRSGELAPGAVSTVTAWVDDLAGGPPEPSADRPRPDDPEPLRLAPVAWYESGWMQLGAIALFLLAFAGYPAVALVRRLRRIRTGPLPGARWLVAAAGSAVLGLLAYFLTLLVGGITWVGPVLGGRSLPWLLLQLLAVGAVAALGVTVWAWWRRRDEIRIGERIRLGLLTAGGVVFVPWALYWGLLLP